MLPHDDSLANLADECLLHVPDRHDAFATLYRRHAPAVLTYCRLRISNQHDAAGKPADQHTLNAVNHRLQEYADCVAAQDNPRIYAFYSDEAIRESEVIQDPFRFGRNDGPGTSVHVSFEDLRLFPDVRAGARSVIDGEAAYLTFVYEDRMWKIDVWDDSNGRRVPLATPVS